MTQPTDTPPSGNHGQGDFEARLRKAQRRDRQDGRAGRPNDTNAFGVATRLVAELVSGLLVGIAIGWGLDKWLGTAPWLLVTFFVLGVGAGLSNVVRAGRQMSADAAKRQTDAEPGKATGSDTDKS